MIGTRKDNPEGVHQPGEYGRIGNVWMACTPNGHGCNLAAHNVIEHKDGSISVAPSILVSESSGGTQRDLWHGYLTKGKWKEC